jgi:outer membrane lipoprotein-sorting protein
MKNIKIVLLIIPCLLLLGFEWQTTTFTPVEDLKALEEKLNSNLENINSIQSDFIQQKELEYLDETIVSKGQFWFKKENQLRWAYHKPFEYAIILSKGKFIIQDESTVNVYDIDSNQAFREINNLIINMVKGSLMDYNKFEIEAFENSSQYLVKLVPIDTNMRKVISNMEVFLDKKDLTVGKIIMHESESDFTVLTFTNKKLNEQIPDSIFSADI